MAAIWFTIGATVLLAITMTITIAVVIVVVVAIVLILMLNTIFGFACAASCYNSRRRRASRSTIVVGTSSQSTLERLQISIRKHHRHWTCASKACGHGFGTRNCSRGLGGLGCFGDFDWRLAPIIGNSIGEEELRIGDDLAEYANSLLAFVGAVDAGELEDAWVPRLSKHQWVNVCNVCCTLVRREYSLQ
jgi:hypothetical protein